MDERSEKVLIRVPEEEEEVELSPETERRVHSEVTSVSTPWKE